MGIFFLQSLAEWWGNSLRLLEKKKQKKLLSHVWVLVFRQLGAGGHDQPRHVTPFEIPCEKSLLIHSMCGIKIERILEGFMSNILKWLVFFPSGFLNWAEQSCVPVCAFASMFLGIFGKNDCHTIYIYSQKQRHIIGLAIKIWSDTPGASDQIFVKILQRRHSLHDEMLSRNNNPAARVASAAEDIVRKCAAFFFFCGFSQQLCKGCSSPTPLATKERKPTGYVKW